MTDNRSLRHADRAPATFSEDDPLAELARIASEFEAAAPSQERETAGYSDDAMAFDLEAELMRSFESDAAHARLAQDGDPVEPSKDVQDFAEAANQDEPAPDAPVDDLAPEEIPAFLKSRPFEDVSEADEPAPEYEPHADEVPAGQARAEEAEDFTAAEDVTVEDAASASRTDDIADEWTDLPEWPQARSSARRASPAEPIEKIDLGPPPSAPTADTSATEEPEAPEIEPMAAATERESAAEPVAAVEPELAALPEDDLPPPIERVSEEAHENHDIIRSFSDQHDDWAEMDEHDADRVEPPHWAAAADDVAGQPPAFSADESYAGTDPVDDDPIWRDFQNYSVPGQAVAVAPEPNVSAGDEWDIAAELESAFSDYDGGRTAASADHDDGASEAYEQAVERNVSHDAPSAALVADEARWEGDEFFTEEPNEVVAPVAHVPYPDENSASFEAVEPPDADEAVIGDVDVSRAPVEVEAALDAPAGADTLRVDEDDMAAMAIDFDDLELEMQTVAAALGDEAASRTHEPLASAESAPPPGAPAAVTPPVPVRQPEPAYVPAQRPASPVAVAAPAVSVAAARDSELVFDTGDVTDTSTFIEPVAALDIPDLPEDERPPAAAVDPDMSELEAEFADILATEPPQRAQAEPAPVAATAENNFDFANYEFADFDSFPANETRESHGTGSSGAAAIPADLAFDDFEHDAPAAADRSGGGDNRKWVLLAGGLVLLAGVSFAGYAFMGGSGTDGGAPPVIAANDEPYKVVPEDPGGRAVPNQDQAVYDRVAGRGGDGNANLVSRTEEPIDVVQRTLDPQVLPLEGRPDDGDPAAMEMPAGEPPAEAAVPQATTVDGLMSDVGAGGSEDAARFGLEPRVVSTMVVRPDGTLVPADSLSTVTPDAAQETASTDTAAPAAPLDDPDSRLAPATEIEDLLAPPRQVATTTLTPDGEPAATEPAVPAQETASAEPAAGTDTAAGGLVGEGAAFSNPGGYVVQIASQPSAESARSTYQSLSGRYASIIGERQAQIQAADIPDRGTFYRVRVAGGTRDEAVALCERYQAAGGSCFVAQ